MVDRHPYLLTLFPSSVEGSLRASDPAPAHGPCAALVDRWNPRAQDEAEVWHPGQFCGASLPQAVTRCVFGLGHQSAHAAGILRPYLCWLTRAQARALAGSPAGQLNLEEFPEPVIVESLTGWVRGTTIEDRFGEPTYPERLGVVLVGHALRVGEADEPTATAYSAAASMTAVCSGSVDAGNLLDADANLAALFVHTPLFLTVGMTQIENPVDPAAIPYWCADVPAFFRAHSDQRTRAEQERTRRTNSSIS